MTVALAPNDEPVNIRKPGAYDHWRRIGGLRCIECGAGVHPNRRQNGNVWLYHDPSDEYRHAATGSAGRESYEHFALASWIYEWLETQGLSPEFNKSVGNARPDVRTEYRGRLIAYEVQLSAIPFAEARERTEKLQALGYEVVWLARNLNWVDRLPAVGLHVQDKSAPKTTDVHGRYYFVREACLACEPTSGELRPGRIRAALEVFLRLHLSQEVQWGSVRYDSYGFQWGWAKMDDWQRHLDWQAKRLAELEAEAQAHVEKHRRLEALLETRQVELARAQADLRTQETTLQVVQGQAEETSRRSREAYAETDQCKRELRSMRQRLQATALGRHELRRLQRTADKAAARYVHIVLVGALLLAVCAYLLIV
jgi:hypothetical protein